MSETRWIRVTTCENVPLREGRPVVIGDRELALFNLGDRFLATDNQCPHKGGPLCDGIVTGSSIVCPLHAWKINLDTGSVERPAASTDHCVSTYETRVEAGVVLIRLPEAWLRESALEDTPVRAPHLHESSTSYSRPPL